MGRRSVLGLEICHLPLLQEKRKIRGEGEAEASGHFD